MGGVKTANSPQKVYLRIADNADNPLAAACASLKRKRTDRWKRTRAIGQTSLRSDAMKG